MSIFTIRKLAQQALNLAILATFFFVPWWLRPHYPNWMPILPYYLGFLISISIVLAILLWLILGLPGLRNVFRDRRRRWIIVSALFVYWIMLSPQWSLFPADSINAAQQAVFAALFGLVVLCAGPSAQSVVAALAAGLIVQSLIAIGQTTLQQPLGLTDLGEFEIRPFNVGLSIVAAGRDHWMRPYGLTIHPNVLAGYLVVALLAMTGWLATSRGISWRWRVVQYGALGIGLWALCLTFSRSAWIAFGVGIAAVLIGWRWRTTIRPARITLILMGIGALVIVGIFSVTYSRFLLSRTGTTGENVEQRSISDRRIYYQIAIQLFVEHPVSGIGVGAYPKMSGRILRTMTVPETGDPIDLKGDNLPSVPLAALTESGAVGFILWLAVWIVAFVTGWQVIRDPYAWGLATGALALLVIGVVDHYPWTVLHFQALSWATMAAALRSQVSFSDQK